MAHISIKMDKELKKDFAKYCKEHDISMSTALCKLAKKAMRNEKKANKSSDVDENGFDAATRAELDRRIADFKAGRNIVEHDLIDL